MDETKGRKKKKNSKRRDVGQGKVKREGREKENKRREERIKDGKTLRGKQ